MRDFNYEENSWGEGLHVAVHENGKIYVQVKRCGEVIGVYLPRKKARQLIGWLSRAIPSPTLLGRDE